LVALGQNAAARHARRATIRKGARAATGATIAGVRCRRNLAAVTDDAVAVAKAGVTRAHRAASGATPSATICDLANLAACPTVVRVRVQTRLTAVGRGFVAVSEPILADCGGTGAPHAASVVLAHPATSAAVVGVGQDVGFATGCGITIAVSISFQTTKATTPTPTDRVGVRPTCASIPTSAAVLRGRRSSLTTVGEVSVAVCMTWMARLK